MVEPEKTKLLPQICIIPLLMGLTSFSCGVLWRKMEGSEALLRIESDLKSDSLSLFFLEILVISGSSFSSRLVSSVSLRR